MLYPSVKEIKENYNEYKIVPVFKEVICDSFTPVHIYKALSQGTENSFILESVNSSNQWGRYSFIGINPNMEIKIDNYKADIKCQDKLFTKEISDPIVFLNELLKDYTSPSFKNMPNLTGGLVGYLGYDTVRYFENKLSSSLPDDIQMPDCHLFLYDELIAYDHLNSKIFIIINIRKDENIDKQYKNAQLRCDELEKKILLYKDSDKKSEFSKLSNYTVKSNVEPQEYTSMAIKAKEHITNGDIFQIVLSQRFEIENPPDSFNVYRMLRAANPSPYLYYFKNKEYQIAGASPEMLVKVTKRTVETKPIAGTIPRGTTEEEDMKNEQILNSDPKERAEHTMLVDLGRNDVGKISQFGSVEVNNFMHIERYSKVMHLVSDVKGKLRDDKSSLDALAAVLPAGTLSGAPKIKAMQLIDELENKRRGLYGGTVGYIGFDGNMDTCIAIRTVLFKNNKAYVQAGAGIVYDSIPENEFNETKNKALAMINAIKEASLL